MKSTPPNKKIQENHSKKYAVSVSTGQHRDKGREICRMKNPQSHAEFCPVKREKQSISNLTKAPSGPQPRGLSISQAAEYVGLSTGRFKAARTSGQYPSPTLPGNRIDLKLLEQYMDNSSNVTKTDDSLNAILDWEARKNANKSNRDK
jgi:hypothetical protein